MKLRHILFIIGLTGPTVVQAQGLSIVGGTTAVKLTSAPLVAGAGTAVAPLGTALLSPGSDQIPIAYFPVTGGSIDTASFAGGIAHVGSGLSLTRLGTTVELENFFINTVTLKLLGDVSVGATTIDDVELFNIGFSPTVSVYPFTLQLTAGAAAALTTFLGLPNLTGAEIGIANTIPITAAVPEPSTYLMMLAGLGLVALLARKRRGLGGGASAA